MQISLNFDSAERQEGAFTSDNFDFPFRFKKGIKEGLVIIFNGWDPYKKYNDEPSFNRWKEFQGLGYSTLYISQPTIFGEKVSHSIFSLIRPIFRSSNQIIPLIKKVRDELKIDNSKIVFYGKSSGCNSATIYSLVFSRSRLLLVNPETNPAAHDYDTVKNIWLFLMNALNKNLDQIKNTANLLTSISKYQSLPYVYLFQNILDESYQSNHIKPFIDVFNSTIAGGAKGGITLDCCCNPRGHFSDMDVHQIKSAIEYLFSKKYEVGRGSEFKSERLIYRRQTSLNTSLEVSIKIPESGSYSNQECKLTVSYDDSSIDVIQIRLDDSSKVKLELFKNKNDSPIKEVFLICEPLLAPILSISTDEYLLDMTRLCE